MATFRSLDLDLSATDAGKQPLYHRLALLNGLFIGLALAAGAWGLEAIRVLQLPFQHYLPTLLLGMGLVTVLSTLVGWLTGRWPNTVLAVVLWLGIAAITTLTMGYLGSYGRTLVAWLADSRFWGRNVYPYALDGSVTGLLFGGFLLFLVLGILGLLQSYRLENLLSNLGARTRFDGRTWIGLLWPMVLVFLTAYFTRSFMFDPAASAAAIINDAVQAVQGYDGDLTELARTTGINYDALAAVRDQLPGDYRLAIAEVDPPTSTVIVSLNYEDGRWLYCRLINDQLSFCYDAAPPYTVGLASLLTGTPVPDGCRGCEPRFQDETLRAEIRALGETLEPPITVGRIAQQGSHVLVSATDANGTAVECWFEGVTRTYLTSCTAVAPAP